MNNEEKNYLAQLKTYINGLLLTIDRECISNSNIDLQIKNLKEQKKNNNQSIKYIKLALKEAKTQISRPE